MNIDFKDGFGRPKIKSEISEVSIDTAISKEYDDEENEKLNETYSRNTEIYKTPGKKREFLLNEECHNIYTSNHLSLNQNISPQSIGETQATSNEKLGFNFVEEYTVPISFTCEKIHINQKTIDESVIKKILESKEIPIVKLYKTEIRNNNYACAVCYDVFYNENALVEHLSKHNFLGGVTNAALLYKKKCKKILKCTRCNFVSRYTSYMRIHKMRHQEVKTYKCDICNYRTSILGNFKTHVKIHSGIKPYKCDFCNYRCLMMNHLKRHKKIHTGEKPFNCVVCTYKCHDSNSLKRHLMIHTGQKPYKCEICDFSCNALSNLKTHKMTHTGERPFACDTCSFRSVTSSLLKRHKLTHLAIKLATCDICQHKSSSMTVLKIHKMVHSDIKPYACNFCDFTCKHSGSMSRHKKIHIQDII